MDNEKQNKSKLFSFSYLPYDFIRLTAMPYTLLWLRPDIKYESEAAKKRIRGGALVIANHKTSFDPVYLMATIWYRRHHYIFLKAFFEGKYAWLFKIFKCIPIDRDNFNVSSFRVIVEQLKAGKLVCMYPEGTRNRQGDDIKTFKSSMVLMSLKSKRPIIPVYIQPKKKWYSRMKAVVGEPIDIVALYGEKPSFKQIDEIAALLQEKEERFRTIIKGEKQ